MRNIMKHGMACASFAIAMLVVPELRAQDPKELHPAPLELVATPADAELVFEISFTIPFGGGNIYSGSGATPVSNRTVTDPHFRLAILDLKTHVLLWTFTEHVQSALLQGNRDKNFDQAMAALVNDIRNVAGQRATAGGGSSQ